MNNTIFLFITLFLLNSISAQEERGEGDIFMENIEDTAYHIKEIVEVIDPNILTAENSQVKKKITNIYTVDYLFTHLTFEEVKRVAKDNNKSYYIDFTADWCAPCKMMDKTTFRDYNVVEYTKKNFIAVQLDITDFDAIELQAMYNVSSLPTILFFDSLGNLTGRATGLQTGTLFFQKLQEMHNFF